MKSCGALILALLLLVPAAAKAADLPLAFSDPLDQQRYEHLLETLRCLVCQNQSLADSHADLAQDLRNEVYRMVGAGHDDDAILEFMVARYGDFVLYRPPMRSSTWLLWLGPLILLLGAVWTMFVLVRRRAAPITPLDPSERAHLAKLLRDEGSVDP